MANDRLAPLLRPQTIRRLLFTAGVLLVYRLGCQVPVPGVNVDVLAGLKGALGIEAISIFALGVTPFFSILFVFELIKLIVPPLSRWETSEPSHAQRLSRVIYLTALVTAGFQARGLANALYGITGLVDEPGWEVPIAMTLVAGTALLCWLGERITLHGLGNGFWLLLITPTLAAVASVAAGSWVLAQQGVIQPAALGAALVFLAMATALIAMTSSASGASAENRVSGADFVSVWPPLFGAYISGFVVSFFALQTGGTAHLLLMAALIAAFNWLQWLGAAPTTLRPVWTIALVQIFVCVGAELLTDALTLPFPISGAWLIVIVTTALSLLRAMGTQPEAPRAQEPAA
jgi:preprotein translocase subunit SecY